MKKEQIVGTRLPDTVVRDLEAIEEVEQSDSSTTVRKTSVSGDTGPGSWTTIRGCMATASSHLHVPPVRRESHSGK